MGKLIVVHMTRSRWPRSARRVVDLECCGPSSSSIAIEILVKLRYIKFDTISPLLEGF